MPKSMNVLFPPIIMLVATGALLLSGCSREEAGAASPAPSSPVTGLAGTSTGTGTTTTTMTVTTQTETLSEPELKQIVMDSVSSMRTVDSYRFDSNTDMKMVTTGGSRPFALDTNMVASGAASLSTGETQMTMDMSISSDEPNFPEGVQHVNLQLFMLTDDLYMKMDIPGFGDQWIKMPVTEGVRAQYDLDMVDQQLNVVDSPLEINLLRYETLEGAESYVLKIVPDMPKILDWLASGQQSSGWVDWESMKDATGAFNDLSYVTWIDTSSKLIKKIQIQMAVDLTPEEAGDPNADFDRMKMDMGVEMKMHGYNEAVTIELPAEARNAIEMPFIKPPGE